MPLFLLATIVGCANSGEGPAGPTDAGPDTDSTVPDSSTDSGTDSGTDAGTDSGTDSGTDAGPVCGEVVLKTNPVTPDVVMIIDQSLSMQDPFTVSSSRWDALKDYLLADDGLINTYQSNVNFGLALYSGVGPLGETCPYVSQVPVSVNNFNAINTVYGPSLPLNDTPTGDAINEILNNLTVSANPTIFVLATDGEPDTCEQPWPQEGQQESINAVTRAYDLGITTYVIGVSGENELSQAHLTDLANAGQGVTSGAESYRVDTDLGLSTVLNDIVSGTISCTVPIEGTLETEDPCLGTVTLNGDRLTCNSVNGWSFSNNSITLNGESCAKLKLGGTLEATFPCGTIYVQ